MKSNFFTGFGVFAFFGLMLIFGVFLQPLVVMKYYEWFVHPIFPSLPKFSWVQVVGIFLTVRALTVSTLSSSDFKEEVLKPSKDRIISALLGPFVALLFGWMIKLIWFSS